MRTLIYLAFFGALLLAFAQIPNSAAGAAGSAPLLQTQSPDATPAPPASVSLPAMPSPAQIARLRPAESAAGETCTTGDSAAAVVLTPDLSGLSGAQYTKYVVWEALNVYGQLFVDPESLLTTQQCSYLYPCGGLPPNCTVVRKARVMGPYCTEVEAWAHLCSRISDRGRFAISSPCPWWIVVDGVRHNSSWNPWTECPKIGGEVIIPPPPANCPTDPPTATPTPTQTPTPTATVTPTPTELPDLTVKLIEVVQATQDEENSIPLVQDKTTGARVYVTIGDVDYDTVKGVSVELKGYRGGDEWTWQPFKYNWWIDAHKVITRTDDNGAVNFGLFDPEMHDTVTLVAHVDPYNHIPETDEENNSDSITVSFNERCPVQMGYVPIYYDTGGPGGVLEPSETFMKHAEPWVFQKIYPIGTHKQLTYFQLLPAITWDGPMDTPENRQLLNVHLRQLLELAQWPQQLRTPLSQLIGWLPDMLGVTNTVGRSDPSWADPGGTDQIFWAQARDDYEWTLAHEIGHNFGLHHPNIDQPDCAAGDDLSLWPAYFSDCTIQEVGYDAHDDGPKDPDHYYDFMTYHPDEELWISPFHYSGDPVGEVGLYQALALPCVAPVTPPPPITPTPIPTPGCTWWYPLDIVAPPWSWVREDPAGWSTTARPGFLRILTGPGDLAGAANNARNLLLQPLLSGNFDASTRLSFAPTADGQAAGLLLYQDDDNYLFLGRAADQGNKVIFVWEHAGAREVHALDFGGLSTYLRIIRNGTSFTGYYGVTADTPFRVFEYQTGMTNFRMGLAAWGGNAAVAAPADFEYYCVNPFGVAADAAPTNAQGPATGAAMSNAVAEPATTAATADYLMISGLLLSDGSGSLNPITRVSLARAPGLPKAGTTFCVALAGAGGAELATYCFDDSLMDYETQKPLGSRPFLMFVPDRPGVADVTLRREELILARRTRSSNAPQVTVVEPAGGELWTGEGRIRWTASDADGDPLHFTVLFSADGKGSWRGLDVDVAGNELVVDSGALPGTGQGYIRVLATDGLNTGQADSRAPIRVADKPPQVTISHPADGATWTPGTVLVLEGSSYDPEDGFLAGSALTWRSDKAGVLGTGTTLSLAALASGDHVITLTGRDAGGQEGSASIALRVKRQTYLPLILQRAGWSQPTPLPPCTLLFREDFSAAGLAGWTPTGGAWTNPGGAMQGASGPVADAWNIKALPAFNFTYEGTVTVRQGNIAGLSFRSTGGTQGYDLFVDVNGSRLVLARRPPYMALGTYAADIQRDRPYRLRVEARWGAIDAYLDGVKRISVIDRTYGMGNFGVYAWNSIAAYDDLIACGLSLPYEQRVDAGISTDTVDTAGRTWMADQGYVAGSWGYTGGTSGYTTHAIAGTEDDPLYQTNRWGSGAWGYKFDLPDGDYRVTLLWAETYWTAAGKRVFDVKIEGQTVIAGLDVFALVGHDAAYQRTFDATVSDGQLNIEFVSVRDAALVAAIEVLTATSATPTPTASRTRTPTATVSPTRTPTATATFTTGPTATTTATPSRTATPAASATASRTPSPTVSPTVSATPSRTATPTASATASRTPSPTASPTVSATPSRTATPTASATASRTPSPTASPTVSETPSRTATPTASATASRTPTATATGTGLYGQITHGGVAVAGVALSLHRYDDTTDDEVATTVTAADGRYTFTGMSSLPAGAAYYVLYGPNSTDPGRVYIWYGPDVTSYTAGANVAAGDFDIANVLLLSPAPGATVTLPATFTWQRRGVSGDTYQVLFADPETDDWWQTSDLGDVGSYTLSGLGEGMVYDKAYYWLIRVFRGPDSYGYSYYMRSVTFQAAADASPAAADLIRMSGSGARPPRGDGGPQVE